MEQLPQHLDHFVVEALKAFPTWQYPEVDLPVSDRNVFIGSGSASCAADFFAEKFGGLAFHASNYKKILSRMQDKNFASINIVSASGGKDSLPMADFCQEVLGQKANLITCNPDAPAKEKTAKQFVFPAFKEPPTYNTSTYGSMLYWLFKEDSDKILNRLENLTIPNLREYGYVFFMADDKYATIADMAMRKVAETNQGVAVNAAGFTQGSHGMLRQPADNRLVFTINYEYPFPEKKYDLKADGYLEAMMLIYYIIGKNQNDQDTANIVSDYAKTVKTLGWQLKEVN